MSFLIAPIVGRILKEMGKCYPVIQNAGERFCSHNYKLVNSAGYEEGDVVFNRYVCNKCNLEKIVAEPC